jgi:hypothetical protein
MKINYTNYMESKKQENWREKLIAMKGSLVRALKAKGVHGHVSAQYYTDGVVSVSVNGEHYNMFDSVSGKWFSGFVGD